MDMRNVDALLNKGLAHHQAGRLREAEPLYREIIQANPQHADALHLVGLLHYQQGKHEAALAYIHRALAVLPRSEVYWANLGAVLHALGRFPQAADAARRVLQLNPNHGRAHFDLGCSLRALGELEQAAASFRRALQIDANATHAYINLGNTLSDLGEMDEAVSCFRKALAINPQYAEAYCNLGAALRDQGNLDEAVQCFQKALEINPQYAEALSNLGVALSDQVKHSDPDESPLPDSAPVVSGRQQLAAAAECFNKALAINPHYADGHKNLGMALLRLGNFQDGWAHYEWRWQTRDKVFKPRNFTKPLWVGQRLDGKSILLHAEQGLGDTLQFARYAPLLRQRGCRVILECQKPLRTLLSRFSGIDQLIARGDELPHHDYHVPLLSLPRSFGTHADNIPAEVPYLSASTDLVRDWQERLSEHHGYKVGICWQGSTSYAGDRQRSMALSYFAHLAEIPNVQLISLQKGHGAEQLANVRFPVHTLGSDWDEAHGAFVDSAAIMKNLDLVVTSDTSIAHLAGALAVPVWVALSKVSDWRWLLERDDTPWYPTMRLFRQEKGGDWDSVFRRIEQALRQRVSTSSDSSRPVHGRDSGDAAARTPNGT